MTKKTLGLIVLLLVLFSFHIWSYSFLNDDAYISFRYAAHWVDYGELTYNLGEKVEGYTNFLWVALLAFGYYLGADIPQFSIFLSVSLALIAVSLSIWYSSKVEAHFQRKNLRILITLTLLCLSPSFACWSTGGLEVQLFTICYMLSIILSLSAWHIQSLDTLSLCKKITSGLWAGLALALASMARPEGLLLFAVLGSYRLCKLIINRTRLKAVDISAIVSFVLLYLPYFMWRYQYYGYLFPNTYYAKVGAMGFWGPGLRYVGEFLLIHPWIIIAVSYQVYGLWTKRVQVIRNGNELRPNELPLVILLAGLAHCIHVARVGGDFMALHRFLVPLLPLAAVWASGVFCSKRSSELDHTSQSQIRVEAHQSLDPATKSMGQRTFGKLKIVCLGLLVTLGIMSIYIHKDANRIGSRNGVDSIGWLRQFAKQCATTGKFIQLNTDLNVKLATTAAGALPFYAQRYTLDLLGLNDVWIAHHVPARGHRPGHTKAAPFRYPIDKEIDLLIYHPSFSRQVHRPSLRMKRALQAHGYEWKSYQVPDLNPQWWSVWQKNGVKINQVQP